MHVALGLTRCLLRRAVLAAVLPICGKRDMRTVPIPTASPGCAATTSGILQPAAIESRGR